MLKASLKAEICIETKYQDIRQKVCHRKLNLHHPALRDATTDIDTKKLMQIQSLHVEIVSDTSP